MRYGHDYRTFLGLDGYDWGLLHKLYIFDSQRISVFSNLYFG